MTNSASGTRSLRLEGWRSVSLNGTDFFGHLIPGFLVFGAVIVTVFVRTAVGSTISELAKSISSPPLDALLPYLMIGIIFLLGFFSYIVGHAVASIAYIVLDRIYLSKIYGWPFRRLLLNEKKLTALDRRSIFWNSVLSIIYGSVLCAIFRVDLGKFYQWVQLVLAALLVLQIASYLSTLVRSKPFASRLQVLLAIFPFMDRTVFWHFVCLPSRVVEWVTDHVTDIDRPLSLQTRERFWMLFQNRTNIKLGEFSLNIAESALVKEFGTDLFWLTFWYVVDRSTEMREILMRQRVVHEMLRNVSACFMIMAAILTLAIEDTPLGQTIKYTCIAFFVCSFVVALRYYFTLYSDHTKSLFRMFIVNDFGDGRAVAD